MSKSTLTVEFNERKIDSIFAAVNQCHLPGAAVGISIAGTPVYRKGFGLATIELPVLLSPSIRMRIHCKTFAR
jgi:D-aminopeptidase